jgi:hypothetical protein
MRFHRLKNFQDRLSRPADLASPVQVVAISIQDVDISRAVYVEFALE